jgi:hypothetical protein
MENYTLKIIDNFLSDQDFSEIKSLLLGSWFSWHYNPYIDHDPTIFPQAEDYPENFQFIHWFYRHYHGRSEHLIKLDPILSKLDPAAIVRIKANLLVSSKTIIGHEFHTDFPDVHCKTAIFYINTNNGKTIFSDGTKVDSVANRIVIFDSQLPHTGTTCTDEKVRCVINFNYFEKVKHE